MGITKLGGALIEKKASLNPYYGLKYLAMKASKASNAVGGFIAKHPKGSLTSIGGVGYAAHTIPDRMHRNMAHADFKQNTTYVKPLSRKVRLVDNSETSKKTVALHNRLY